FFSSRRRHTRFSRDWSSDVCSSDLKFLLCKSHKIYQLLLVTKFLNSLKFLQFVFLHIIFYIIFNSKYLFTIDIAIYQNSIKIKRSEERRVGKECRSRW